MYVPKKVDTDTSFLTLDQPIDPRYFSVLPQNHDTSPLFSSSSPFENSLTFQRPQKGLFVSSVWSPTHAAVQPLPEQAYSRVVEGLSRLPLSFRKSIPSDALIPPKKLIDIFIQLYFNNFSPLMPILCPHLFGPKVEHWILIFAVSVVGAIFSTDASSRCSSAFWPMKATLLSHGYTVAIKATTEEKQHILKAEVDNYHRLEDLQGHQIPVCLGDFEPSIEYWYHGRVMAHFMILSWSGTRLQRIINDENLDFFSKERKKALKALQERGAEHRDKEWRNMLWNEQTRSLVVVDLEDMKWLKRPRPLQLISGNSLRRRIVQKRNNK